MAEVGVLEIQIHDNSAKAASGLDNLASALTRVQNALGSKLKIGTMATQIGKLVEKMQTAIPEESISRIERLAAAVEKLGAVGKVSAPSLKGLKIDSVKEAAKDAGGGDMFSESASTIETINEAQEETVKKIVEEKAAAREAQEAMQGVAESTERAAEEAGNVSEAMAPARDAIQEAKEEARQMKEEFQGASKAAERIKSSTWSMKRFNPATGQFEAYDSASETVSAAEKYQSNVQRRFQNEVADFRRDLDFQGSNSTASLNSASIDTMFGIGSSSIKSAEESLGVFIEKASDAQKVSWELMDTLNRPVTLDLASAINQTLGIGAPIKSAEESLNVFIERATNAQRASWELMDTLNRPVDLNWANAIDKMQGIGAPFKSAEDSMNVFIERASEAQRISWELIDTLNTPVNLNWADAIEQLQGIGAPVKSAEESMSAFMQAMQGDSGTAANIRELNPELQELCDEAIRNGTAVSSLTGKLADLDGELKQKKKDTNEARSAFQQFKDSISSMTAPISGFIGQLARIARYRMLRAIIKQISEGFKEGVENYYHYSEAINNGFSAAMDSAATSLQTFKNSIGAAVAPIIQALIPVLQQAVTWFVSLINYANQFIALLSGKTSWSMAVDTTAKAFEETKKKAGGATKAIKDTDKAVKDLLADFDELNIIQSETGGNGGSGGGGGGGGSGKTATDYTKMFTEVSNFDNGIKSLVENLKDNFGSILNLAAKIGAAVLAWRVSSAFSGIIGQAAGLLGSAIILDVVFRLSKTFTSTFLDTGKPGWLLLSGLTPLVGGFIARRLLTQVGLTGMAAYVIPVSLGLAATATISAVLEDADVSALDAKSIEALIQGAIEAGAATGLALNAAGVLTAAEATGAGAAAALVTFGVAIGLKATKEVAENGMITEKDLTADAISALFIGGGLAVAGGVIGLSAGTIAGVAAVGAVATFGVLVGIQAILSADEEEPVKWGSTKLTQEQIDAFVGNMFTVKPSVVIEMLEEKINLKEGSREELQRAVTKTLGTLQLVKLGLDTGESLDQLKNDVFTGEDSLMSRFKNYAKDQVVQVQTTLSFVKTEGENGKTKGETTAEKITEGWSSLTGQMDTLGKQLSNAFETAYSTEIGTAAHNQAVNTIETLTQMMTDISTAITYGTETAKVLNGFESLADGITRETASSIIKSYKETKDQILESQKEALSQTAEGTLALSLAFTQLSKGKNITQEQKAEYERQANEYMDLYREQLNNLQTDAEAATEEIVGDSKTRQELHDYLVGIIDKDFLAGDTYSQSVFSGLMDELLAGEDTFSDEALRERFTARMLEFLRKSIPDDAQIYIDAFGSNLVGYGEVFNDAFLQSITDSLDLGNASEDVRDRYIDIIRSIFGDEAANKINLPAAEVEQEIEIEPEIVETEPEVSDEGGFDLSNLNLAAGNFDFNMMDLYGADSGEYWGELFYELFPEDGSTNQEAANALRQRLNDVIEMAFAGTGEGANVLKALEKGDLKYGEVIMESVIKSIEEAMGVGGASDEVKARWREILKEIFGGEYAPEIDIDPEVTGKTNGTQWGVRVEQTASRATGYGGDAGVWAGSRKLYDTWDKTTDAESVQAGVQAGTAQMQTDLQNGMANRKIDIQNGVQAGTGSLLTALNNILATAQAIGRKEFTVNLVPSAGFGRFMGQSSDEYSRVTGDV